MIKKIKIEQKDNIKILGINYESRGIFVLLLQLLRNYNEENDLLIKNLYNKLLKKIIEEKLIFQFIALKYIPLEDNIYRISYDSNSGLIFYNKKYNIKIKNIQEYSFDKLLQYSPYQYIEQYKLKKIITDKNKIKIEELLNDINLNIKLFQTENIHIQELFKQNEKDNFYYNIFDNKIIIFNIMETLNE